MVLEFQIPCRSGWSSGVRGSSALVFGDDPASETCADARFATSAAAARSANSARKEKRRSFMDTSFLPNVLLQHSWVRLLPVLPVKQLFNKLSASKLHKTGVWLQVTVQ